MYSTWWIFCMYDVRLVDVTGVICNGYVLGRNRFFLYSRASCLQFFIFFPDFIWLALVPLMLKGFLKWYSFIYKLIKYYKKRFNRNGSIIQLKFKILGAALHPALLETNNREIFFHVIITLFQYFILFNDAGAIPVTGASSAWKMQPYQWRLLLWKLA